MSEDIRSNPATAKMIEALESLGVPYMVVGSLSANLYGIPRSTKDADFVVQFDPVTPVQVAARLGDSFQLEPQSRFESVTGTTCHRIQVRGSGFKIELFELSNDDHDQERFRRRVRVQSPDGRTWVPRPEDVVITKLRWALRGKRGKDHDDVRDVISVSGPQLDWDYVHRWADIHGTRKLLDELRASIPPI